MSNGGETRFNPTDRVRIAQSFTWAQGAVATVSNSSDVYPWPFAGHFRDVPGVKGLIRFYWLVFDMPQIDADGDGPYVAAEIAESYLEPVLVATDL